MPAPERASRAYRLVAHLVRPVLMAVTRRRWSGAEHLHRSGGFIVAANHTSNVDPLTFAHFLWDNGVAPRVLAKDSLFRVPVVGAAMRATGQIPVARGTVSAGRSLEDAERALGEGECVAVFPEGTLTREPDLWPMRAKTGVARLALATRAPVVPVAQWGATDLLPRYSWAVRPIPPAVITVVAGPPVDLDDLYPAAGAVPDAATLREATERIMAEITGLLETIRGTSAPTEQFVWRLGMAEPGRRGH